MSKKIEKRTIVLIKRKLHFRTAWQVKICNQHIWKYFIGEIISTLRLKEIQLFGQDDGEWVTAHRGLEDSYILLLHFQFLFIQTALITSLFTVLKKGSKKKRTYLLHRHRQDNAAEKGIQKQKVNKYLHSCKIYRTHSSLQLLHSSPLPPVFQHPPSASISRAYSLVPRLFI